MDKDDRPVDWVGERARLSGHAYLGRLHRLATSYIQAHKNLVEKQAEGVYPELFSATDYQTNKGLFIVQTTFGRQAPWVQFRLEGNGIVVEDSSVRFSGRPIVNAEGKGKLLVGAEELDVWQVVMRALEPMFFLGPELSA